MYNGYKNYQTWNVCLWISNDEGLHKEARGCASFSDFVYKLRNEFGIIETPDFVAYNDSGIDLDEMKAYWDETFPQAAP